MNTEACNSGGSSSATIKNDINHPSTSFQYSSTLTYNAASHHAKRLLASNYEPGEYDVICGRGSKCFNHVGNQHFRSMVEQYLTQYSSSACNKHEKTAMIVEIVNRVRNLSQEGGFIKKDPVSGCYYEVGDFLAV
jgi:hypothetical protein